MDNISITPLAPKKSNTCTCCKKVGHNITTCVSAVKQGILIENHILAMQECATNEIKFRLRLLQYLRGLSSIQQKILSSRIGDKKISYSTVLRYLSYKSKSRKVMHKIYGSSSTNRSGFGSGSSVKADKIFSPTFSEKPERKKNCYHYLL